MAEDVVNHPSHYTTGTLEVIDAIEGMGLPYHEGNIVKYVARWRHKAGVVDLKKARWYLNRLIETEEAKQVAELAPKVVEGTSINLVTIPKPEHYRPQCICDECVQWRAAFAAVTKVACPHHGPGEYCVSCFPTGWNLDSK